MRAEELIYANRRLYRRVQVAESVLEGLLRTHSAELFPDYRYFDFRPAIPSRYGSRHPDGALLSPSSEKWWVVEIETHVHDVEVHVAPQLEGLSEGIYGNEAFRYLERSEGFTASDYRVNVWEPEFLLIVDLVTPQMASAAAMMGFSVLECAVYRSDSLEYAVRVSGLRPMGSRAAPRGIDVELVEANGVTLLVPLGGRTIGGARKRSVTVGSVEMSAFLTDDGRSLVLPATSIDIAEVIGEAATYRLTSDQTLLTIDA